LEGIQFEYSFGLFLQAVGDHIIGGRLIVKIAHLALHKTTCRG